MDKQEAIEKFKLAREKKQKLDNVLDEVYSPEEAKELKQIIASYFGEKLSKEMQRLAEENGWTPETYIEWSKEHFRTPYNPS